MTKLNREKLKNIGMETEFHDWLQHAKSVSRGFHTGDRVQINIKTENDKSNWERLGVRHGDEGKILWGEEGSFLIEFDIYPHTRYKQDTSWWVNKRLLNRI